MKTTGGPEPMSMTFTRRPSIVTHRWCSRQSTSIHGERPAGTVVAGRVGQRVEAHPAWRMRIIRGRDGPRRMRIAIDIDSTLHHYWDELADAAKRRFGVDLPYEHQHTWKISRLRDEQLRVCIADTHSDAAIARAQPYPDAVEIVNAWHDAGHWIHVTSHRAERCHAATERWLAAIGLQLRRPALLLRQGQPLRGARHRRADRRQPGQPRCARSSNGMVAATLVHPWNRELCEEEAEVVSAGGLARPGRARSSTPAAAAARGPIAASGMIALDARGSPHLARPRRRGRSGHRPAPLPARRRARAPGHRLGALGARRGPHRPHADRVLLPAVVPLRGRGDRERAGRGRRAAGLQPLRRAAARRADDRQGDQGGALAPAPAPPDGRALLQGLPGLQHAAAQDRRACPRTRPTSTACSTTSSQLVLVFPEGRKGTEKLYKDRYRLRRFGRGGFVEAAMRARAPIVPIAVVGAEEAAPIFAQVKRAAAPDRAALLPDHADLPALRAARHARLPAGQVQAALPAPGAHRPTPPSATSRGRTRRSCRPSPTRSAPRIQDELARHARRSGAASGSDELQADPAHRPVDVLGRPARPGARARPGRRGDHRRRPPPAEGRAAAHRVRARDRLALAHPPHRRGGRDRHRGRHAARGRLDRHQPAAGPREQRHRAR